MNNKEDDMKKHGLAIGLERSEILWRPDHCHWVVTRI